MNFIGRSRLYLLLVLLQCSTVTMASISSFASCTSSSFSRSVGYILHGFLLGEIEVGDFTECKNRCIFSENCLSFNILMNSNGPSVCQLNSERKEDGVREQFVQHGAGQYYGLKAKKLCSNNAETCDNVTPWYAFNQSYFQYVNIKQTHSGAQKYCEEQNGGLASISSEEEQTFLHKLFLLLENGETPYMRIGMNDIAEAGVFVWDDGSPVTHMRFRPGEPNDGEDGNCMVLYKGDGGFTDARCDYETFSFCESDYSRLFS